MSRQALSRMVFVAVLAVFGASFALAQEAAKPERRQRRRWDPAQMRARMLERMKEVLACGDEEWTVLQPRLEKVMTLSREARSGSSMRVLFSRRRRQESSESQPQSAVAKAAGDLGKTLENKEAKPEEIKAKLTALREAREKAKQDLAKAQAELREIITQRQEALLVLMGTLD